MTRAAGIAVTAVVLGCTGLDHAEEGTAAEKLPVLGLSAALEGGAEVTWCQYVLGRDVADDGAWLAELEHSTEGLLTHHVIWYLMDQTLDEVAGQTAPFRCDDGVHRRKKGVLYAPPADAGRLKWPGSVASRLEPSDVTLIEWHVLNPSAEPAEGAVTIRARPPETDRPIRAGTMLLYDWFVYVPAESKASSTTRCRVPENATMTWASQHMHERGIRFEARLLDSSGALKQELLYTTAWDADPLEFPQGIEVRAGDWLEFECTWNNPDPWEVIEGDGADDEMCMLVAGYFPAFDTPFGEMCLIGQGSGPVFSGDATCSETLECMRTATDRVEMHRCWAGTRQEDSSAITELAFVCAQARCEDVCVRTGIDDDCLACLEAECPDRLATCEAAGI